MLTISIDNYDELKPVIEFIKTKHGNQQRVSGGPYYLHPIAVAKIVLEILAGSVKDEDPLLMIVLKAALCHDILEDTKTTTDELVSVIGERATCAVEVLTKPGNETLMDRANAWERNVKYYSDTFAREHPGNTGIARIIKRADRIHNLSEMAINEKWWKHRYLCDTMILIGCLKAQADVISDLKEQVFQNELEAVYWNAVMNYCLD